MDKKVISWNKDLGDPTKPGTYQVTGIGEVTIHQDQIEKAKEFGGNVDVEIVDVTTLGRRIRQFIISFFIPRGTETIMPDSEQKTSTSNMQSIDVFISHSGQDRKIAKAVIDLIRDALNIPAGKIRCTSVDGYKLPVGVPTDDSLRQEIFTAKLFVGLITPASLESTYVLFELGARWGNNLPLAPVLACGMDANSLQAPLKNRNALSLEKPADIHQLLHNISEALGYTLDNPSAYHELIGKLVKKSRKGRKKLEDLVSSDTIDSQTYFCIVSKESEKCLDVAHWGTQDGALIHQYQYQGSDNQLWYLRPAEDNYHYVISKHSRKYLEVMNSSMEDGPKIQQWSYAGSDNQKWKLEQQEDGSYRITAKHSGKCLDLSNASKENEAAIWQHDCHKGKNQKWWINQVIK